MNSLPPLQSSRRAVSESQKDVWWPSSGHWRLESRGNHDLCLQILFSNVLNDFDYLSTSSCVSKIKEKLSDHEGKLQEAQDLLNSARGKARQAGLLTEQNKANLTALQVQPNSNIHKNQNIAVCQNLRMTIPSYIYSKYKCSTVVNKVWIQVRLDFLLLNCDIP